MFWNTQMFLVASRADLISSDGASRLGLTVSVSRLASRPSFASLCLGLEGFGSRDFEYCKEMVY